MPYEVKPAGGYAQLSDDWAKLLPVEVQELAQSLAARAQKEREAGKVIYPPQDQLFRALWLTAPKDVRCVILGQDPYMHEHQANGLAFSVNQGEKLPPSLKNIYKELHADIGCEHLDSGDLTPWAEHGVLLLNTALTVEEGKANSHSAWGWGILTSAILDACVKLSQPIVFLLWGGKARYFAAHRMQDIEQSPTKAYICCSHPSPLGATKGSSDAVAFIGSRVFSKANRVLVDMGAEAIDWSVISQKR